MDVRVGSTRRRFNDFVSLRKDIDLLLPQKTIFAADPKVRQKQLSQCLNSFLKKNSSSDAMNKFLNVSESKKSSVSFKSRPVSDKDEPTRVEVNYFIQNITDISAAESTFDADFYLDLYWTDVRLVGMDGDDLSFGEDVWIPEIEFPNGRDVEKDFENYILDSKSGHVTYQTRIRAKFTALMSLEKFPFDRQVLCIGVESGAHEAEEVILIPFGKTKLHLTQELRENGLAEWRICSISSNSKVTTLEFDGSKYSTFTTQISLTRRPGYYLSKIIMPFTLIVAMSLSVYAMDPSEIGDRIGTSIEAALTATAFQVAINDSLPRVGYMTVLDKFIMVTFCVMCLSCAVTVYAYREHASNPEWIACVDNFGLRLSVTTVFLALMYVLYENSNR
eukprot:g153.t1